MKISRIAVLAVLPLMLAGCSIFKKYSAPDETPSGVFGEEVSVSDRDSTLGDLSWREFFTDPVLERLIDSALVRNTDLKVAELRAREAEIALGASKLMFLPGISFTPYFNILNEQSYTLPLSLSWDNEGLGSLMNRKREAQAKAAQALDSKLSVQSRMIANLADAYYQLLLLDRQYQIMLATEKVWTSVYETQKALMENGKSYSTSVDQMASSLLKVKIQMKDIADQIKDVEYSICLMLNQVPQHIERSGWGEHPITAEFNGGVPASLLQKRPDVRVAGKNVEAAYYVKAQALGAMFPSLSLSGALGWTTDGLKLKDPARMVYDAVVSLAQPVFARGQLQAKYRISKLQQEEAARIYSQTLLDAGNEVNKSLRACQLSSEKGELYAAQVKVLEKAYSATTELMRNGKASYIEVLIAQDNLLNAQLSEAANMYSGTIGLITLYISLGGGVK